jgi:predicted RNA-binding protein associated with RNAse of E/G family
MPSLPPVLEVKRTLSGREKRFDCRLLAADARHAVLLWVAAAPMRVHGVELPAGTVSFGHFWTDRLYNVYHWVDASGATVGFYFNIADETRIAPGRLDWRDLTVDVLATPAGRLEVLDEDELPADLDPALRRRIDLGKASILDAPARVMAEIEAASAALRPLAFPDAAA